MKVIYVLFVAICLLWCLIELFCFLGKHDNDLINVAEDVSNLKMFDLQSCALSEDRDVGKYLLLFYCCYIRSFVVLEDSDDECEEPSLEAILSPDYALDENAIALG